MKNISHINYLRACARRNLHVSKKNINFVPIFHYVDYMLIVRILKNDTF